MDTLDLLLRVGMATCAGALIGIERETRAQLAGMRTNALVAVGACLFTLGGAYGFPELARSNGVDPMRVAAQIVSGIGFIGAGTIIRDRGATRGVTTAAALWVSASLGMMAGAGLFVATWIGVAAVLTALVGLRLVRNQLRRLLHTPQSIAVTYERGHGTLGPLITSIEDSGGRLHRLHIDDDDDKRHVSIDVGTRDIDLLRDLLGKFATRPEIDAITY